jgi:hypothetical protein
MVIFADRFELFDYFIFEIFVFFEYMLWAKLLTEKINDA